MIDTTYSVTYSIAAPLVAGETLTTPRGHRLSVAYDNKGHVYNLTVERNGAAATYGWPSLGAALARAEVMMLAGGAS